jgi:phosphoenolpyruvate-protein phosphotransferase (PTS system enzyme I)
MQESGHQVSGTTMEADTHPMRVLKGIAASPGIAIGRAFVLDADQPVDEDVRIAPDRIANERERFLAALKTVAEELENAVELARQESSTVSSIVESYVMIASDPIMADEISAKIQEGMAAEAATARVFDAKRAMLLDAHDAYLRSRSQDFQHIKERLIAILRNRTLTHASGYDSIVVAPSVTPQDMLFFKQTQTLGYVTEIGGINSHTCILARDMGYPAVIGIRNAADIIAQDSILIVDGYSGVVVVNPDDEKLALYRDKQKIEEANRKKLGSILSLPTVTTDGVKIRILSNVDDPDQVDVAMMSGGEGIGLVRSEVLLIRLGRYPSMEEQLAWYRDIAERAYPKPVTIRAFDVGNDKFRQGIPHHEENPALGLRGIRFLLYRPDIFEEQICAVLRSSVHRNVRLMLPMVSMLEELDEARRIVKKCQERLRKDGIDFDDQLQVGVMIETPAAAMMADSFAQHADFLSIGTNDLAQYALATDRTNELVANIYDALHPAVIRMLRFTVEAADRHNKSVSVCGEMAGHAAATEMLIGLGLREFSVAPRLLLELKKRILNASAEECRRLELRLEVCTTTQEVYAVLNSLNEMHDRDRIEG